MVCPRILFLDHSGRLGGAELYLLDLIRPYVPGSKVVLLEGGPFAERLQARGIPHEVVPAGSGVLQVTKQATLMRAVRAIPRLWRPVCEVARRARAFDLVYANSQKAFLVAALARLLVRKPLVWNLHDMLTAGHFSALNRRVAVALSNLLATRVVANSEATVRAYRASGGRAPAGVVYNGIDASAFANPEADDAARLRERYGVQPGAPLVGLFGRVAAWKGQHVLVRALEQVPKCHAFIVGDALFESDRAYAEALRNEVHERGLDSRVHFLGFQDDVAPFMQAVDVVVHASTEPEPFGRVVVEGMLAGRPVVAAAAGGILEIIEDGVTGRLVPPGDPETLAGALAEIIERPAWARRLAEAGRRRARSVFSLEAMLQQADREIRTALAGRGCA